LRVHGKDLEQRLVRKGPDLRPLTTSDFLTDIEKEIKHIGEEDMD